MKSSPPCSTRVADDFIYYVRSLRIQNQLPISRIAYMLGMSENQYDRLENLSVTPTTDQVIRLSKLFGFTLEEFFDLRDKATHAQH